MEIKPPTQYRHSSVSPTEAIPATQNNRTSHSVPPAWNISQEIQAVILKVTEQRLLLDIQGTKAHTAKPTLTNLQVGDILKLYIEQLKPTPQFKIIGIQKSTHMKALVQNLIKPPPQLDANLIPMLKNISYVASRPALRPSPLTAEVNAAVREIFKDIPAPFNLKTGQQIKNQLQNSGLFIENKIKNTLLDLIKDSGLNKTGHLAASHLTKLKSIFEHDLSAQLHRLASLIRTQNRTANNATKTKDSVNNQHGNKNIIHAQRNVIEQASLQTITQREEAMQSFLRQIESSLNHIQQSQLQNLNESQTTRPAWLMELPIKDGQNIDLFKIKINQEHNQKGKNKSNKIWNVTLQFNLQGLGEVKAHIKMFNELISTQFYSENSQTLSLFRENFDFLRSRLNCNGLNVGNIECIQRKLNEDPSNNAHHRKLYQRT